MSLKSARVAVAPKPLKRPTQARARATVQAVFDAFVRIWQRDGWERLTTRAVALEAGIAVGTLYDYFPGKEAILSGYVRHSLEVFLAVVEQEAVRPVGLCWQDRIGRLVRLACGVERHDELPRFDRRMIELESLIAEPKHQRRAHEDLLAAWHRVVDACSDLPQRPAPATVQALHLAVWGGRRYAMLVQVEQGAMSDWAAQMERLCCWALSAPDAAAHRLALPADVASTLRDNG